MDDRRRVADPHLWVDLGLLGLLLQLHVEEPLVDLDARQSSLAHRLFPDFSVPLATEALKQLQ